MQLSPRLFWDWLTIPWSEYQQQDLQPRVKFQRFCFKYAFGFSHSLWLKGTELNLGVPGASSLYSEHVRRCALSALPCCFNEINDCFSTEHPPVMFLKKNEINGSHGDWVGACWGKCMLTGSRNMIIISYLRCSNCSMITRCIMQVEGTREVTLSRIRRKRSKTEISYASSFCGNKNGSGGNLNAHVESVQPFFAAGLQLKWLSFLGGVPCMLDRKSGCG